MPENIEKNMYLRRHQDKITLLQCSKNKISYDFLLKLPYHDVQKYCKNIEKKHVLNTNLICRFSWYSLEVDVGHLGADFGLLGGIFSPGRQM